MVQPGTPLERLASSAAELAREVASFNLSWVSVLAEAQALVEDEGLVVVEAPRPQVGLSGDTDINWLRLWYRGTSEGELLASLTDAQVGEVVQRSSGRLADAWEGTLEGLLASALPDVAGSSANP